MWRFLLYGAALGALFAAVEVGWIDDSWAGLLVVLSVLAGFGILMTSIIVEGRKPDKDEN